MRFITTTKAPAIDTANFSVIILSSLPVGRGLYSTPITMFPVNNKENILDTQYNAIKIVFPKADIFVVTGFNTHIIASRKPKEIRLIENQIFAESSETEEAKIGINATNTNSVVLIAGNTLFNEDCLNQVKTKQSVILIDRKSEEEDTVGVTEDKSKLENMSYGLPNKWCGISHITGYELELFKSLLNSKSKSKLCLFEIFNLLVKKGGIIYTVEHNFGYIQRNIK